MIQRIQTVYLLLAALCMVLLPWFFPLFTTPESNVMLLDDYIFLTGFLLVGALSIWAIFKYKNRQTQVVLGRAAILLSFVLFGFLIYYYYQRFDTANVSLGTSVFMPLAAVVLVIMANRAIMKDEALVRAADRFR